MTIEELIDRHRKLAHQAVLSLELWVQHSDAKLVDDEVEIEERHIINFLNALKRSAEILRILKALEGANVQNGDERYQITPEELRDILGEES